MTPLLGLFIGGAAQRMGGLPKGLIQALDSGESLLARHVRIGRELALEPCLIGGGDAYVRAFPELLRVADAPAGVGPLGGLRALCLVAGERPVVALACDVPFVSPRLLARLVREQPGAAVLAPRGLGGYWEPLCARYDPLRVLPWIDAQLAQNAHSLQALLRAAEVAELTLGEHERAELVDWDSPGDLQAGYALPRRDH